MLLRKPASELWDDDEARTKKIAVDTERVNELRCRRMKICGLICKKCFSMPGINNNNNNNNNNNLYIASGCAV